MKQKLLKTFLFLTFLIMPITNGYAGYQIQEDGPETGVSNVDENKDTNKDYHKVTFQNTATEETTTRYFEDGYILSMADLADATNNDPNTMYVSGNQYLSWKASGGTYNGQSLSKHIDVTEDMLLTGTAANYTNTVSASCLGANNTSFASRTESTYQTTTLQSTYDETLDYGEQFIGTPDNIIHLTSEGYNQSVETRVMGITASEKNAGITPSFTNGQYFLTSHVKQTRDADMARGNSVNYRLSHKDDSWLKNQTNGYGYHDSSDKFISYGGDSTIGLSNPEANSSEGGDSSKRTPYKYQNASSNSGTKTYNSSANSYSRNYCVTRFSLQNDIIFSANITLGGITGYFGNNLDFSQSGYQGFIIGNYCEIDLNGYDLIMPNGSKIISYGSITDSSRFNDSSSFGTLIMLPGSSLQSPFVIEDVFLPMSAPVSFFNNNSPFNFYRCPYLDCKIVFYAGSYFSGEYKVDLAGITNIGLGNNGNVCLGVTGLVSFIGAANEENNLLQLSNGKIIRDVRYNESLTKYASDLFNQEIHYYIENAELTFANWLLDFNVAGNHITMDSRKYQFFLPFYFKAHILNSTIYLNQEIVFMAGSYLDFDRNSNLILSYSSADLMTNNDSFIDYQTYQSVGGLTFLDTFYYSEPGTTNYPLYDARNTNLLSNSSYAPLWKSLAATPAYADFDGKIIFRENRDSSNNLIPMYHSFRFGGMMDIENMSAFRRSINDWNSISSHRKVSLFGNYFMLGPNTAPGKTSIGQNYFYVRGFYTPPLMNTEREVLVDVTTVDYSVVGGSSSSSVTPESSAGISLSNKPEYHYDSITGLIDNGTSTYAFIPDYSWSHSWDKTNKANFYGTVNLQTSADSPDDLSGSFFQVTNNGNYISINGTDYGDGLTFNRPINVFYRGSFVYVQDSINGNTATTYLYRYAGGDTGDSRTRLYSLSFSNNVWTLKGAAENA